MLGYLGMPRRYYEYSPEFQVLERDVDGRGFDPGRRLCAAARLSACSRCTRPPDAGPNPWRATGLEWQTESPPPVHNFDETPVVTRGPYAYSPEAAEGMIVR